MDIKVEEKRVLSSDKIHELVGKIYIPDCQIKGVFHLVHGMTEHIGRYDSFLRMIAQNGYICFGYDHLGHGKTAINDSELGFIAEKKGYERLVDDVKLFADAVKKEYPGIPYILFGHSMGSFIVRLTAEKNPKDINKLIICGTGGANPMAPFGLAIINLIELFKGKHGYSKFVEGVAFGSYNNRTEKETPIDWLTTDRSIIKTYASDKFCTFHFTVSAMHDLVKLNMLCNRKQWFKNVSGHFPILIVSGDEDPVGNYGNGVKQVYRDLKASGQTDVKMILYKNCRHEIHNDVCKEDMFNDILEFLAK